MSVFCLTACPPVCLFVSLSVCLPDCLSVGLYISPDCKSVYLYICRYDCLPSCPPACLPVRLLAHLPVCLTTSPMPSICLFSCLPTLLVSVSVCLPILYIFLSIFLLCPDICLFSFPSHRSPCLPTVCLSAFLRCLSVSLSLLILPVCLSSYPTHLSVCLSVCLSLSLSLSLSVLMSANHDELFADKRSNSRLSSLLSIAAIWTYLQLLNLGVSG